MKLHHNGEKYEAEELESDDNKQAMKLRCEMQNLREKTSSSVFKSLDKIIKDTKHTRDDYKKTQMIVEGNHHRTIKEAAEYVIVQTQDGYHLLFEVYKKSRIIRGKEMPQ